ncbi:MAG: hypothetical protein GY896_22865 [Gammaproteobacteria bacterium]|nr:hypothetical protein [Gammaproteobacteria bacterium]
MTSQEQEHDPSDEQREINKAATADEETAVNEDEVGKVVTGDGSGEALPEMPDEEVLTLHEDGTVTEGEEPTGKHGASLEVTDEIGGVSEELAAKLEGTETPAPGVEPKTRVVKRTIDETDPKLAVADKLTDEANALTNEANALTDENKTEEAEAKLKEAGEKLAEADRLLDEIETRHDDSIDTGVLACPKCKKRKTVNVEEWTGATRCTKCSAILTANDAVE